MTTQPEALRLADAFDKGVQGLGLIAAALLRRQHEEIERLTWMKDTATKTIDIMSSASDKKDEALRVALEALKRVRRWAEADQVNYTGDHPVAMVRESITKIKEVLG